MMKHVYPIFFAMLFGLLFAACSEDNAAQSPVSPMTEAAQLSAEVSSKNNERIVVKGKSNLPERTQLVISLENKAAGFRAEKEGAVMKGTFSVTLTAPKGGLKAGAYQLHTVTAVAAGQTEKVQKAIGNQGQHLSGPLAKDISWGGRVAEVESTYNVE